MTRVGFHLSIAGGLPRVFDRARALGCTTFQIFTSNPRSWRARPISDEEASAFLERARASGIDTYFAHMPYLANLCASEPLYSRSIAMLERELARCALLGVRGLVVHVGKLRGRDYGEGVRLIARAIDAALSAVEGVFLLLENTAGQGTEVGSRLEELFHILCEVKREDRVGICLDTAHAFQAGYPIHTEEGLDAFVDRFSELFGNDRLMLVHLNDSKTPLGSRVDRHWHIGEGEIGEDGFRTILSHPLIRSTPLVMETPWGEQWDRRNMERVRGILATCGSGGSSSPPLPG